MTNKIELANGQFVLFWNISKNDIIFELHVNTTGLVCLGLSSSGDPNDDFDLFTAWISNGQTFLYVSCSYYNPILLRNPIITIVYNFKGLLCT